MKLFILTFCCFLSFSSLALSQSNEEVVATVGGNSITVDELQYRYELTPQMFRENENARNKLKMEFLYTLIAEKLLASYGETSLLDTAEIVRNTLKYFEEMFVRDELYKRMVVEKAKYKADSLLGFYLINSTEVMVTYIRTNRLEEVKRIYELLKNGVPFDFFYSDTSLSRQDTLTIKFGQFSEYAEDEILTLPANTFSEPTFIDGQWYIMYIVKKLFPIMERTRGWGSEYKRLSKLAKERAEFAFYKDYMKSIFGNLNVKANGKLLKLFSEEIYLILESKKLSQGQQGKYFLAVSDLALADKRLSEESLNSTFVNLPIGSIPLRDFTNFLRFENLSFDSLDYQNVLDKLNGKTRKFIEYKMLANEGYKLRLEKYPDVQKQYNMWKQNYFYQLVLAEFTDSVNVSDDEVKTYYNQLNKKNYKVKEVNVVEVLVRDPETAEKVLLELESGKDIKEAAADYSIREDAKFELETGFKPISYFKEIGAVLNNLNIGEVYGPMKVSEGYSIFKLIGVKEDSTYNTESFDQVKKELTNELRHLKMKQSINEFIAKLAKQNNIVINKEVLSTIKSTTHNSLVFKLLGFGGKITAVPLIAPNSEWVELWLNSLKEIP